MFILAGFGDEISPKLEEQLDVLESEGIKYLELRSVNNKNVLDLTDDEIEKIKKELDKRKFGISAIGSPIGKIGIKDNFEQHLERFKRAIHLAKFFRTKYIRIFSYYIPEKEEPEKYRDEVMKRMNHKVKIAEQENIVLLHENEHGIYGDIPERCKDIFETIDSQYLRCNFDPCNFVLEGVKPYTQAFPLLKKYIEYLHIKDATYTPAKIVPAGEGEGEIKEILLALKSMNFDGFLSLEPHLAAAGKTGGFSSAELFKVASKSLKKILNEVEKGG